MNQEDFMAGAWASFVAWASREPDILAQFKAETGKSFSAPFVKDFVLWVTERHWGFDEAPLAYRAANEDKRQHKTA